MALVYFLSSECDKVDPAAPALIFVQKIFIGTRHFSAGTVADLSRNRSSGITAFPSCEYRS